MMVFAGARAQDYSILGIADSLKTNANAVLRLERTEVDVRGARQMNVSEKRVVTVFNAKGLSAVGAVAHYDKRSSVDFVEATVYDALGQKLKVLKRKDFRDQLAIDGATFFSDSRLIYLDYTPTQYPFTMVYECKTTTSNTAFLPSWTPVDNYGVGIERSEFVFRCEATLGLHKKEYNFNGFPVKRADEGASGVTYTLCGMVPQKHEDMGPSPDKFYPKVRFGLERFSLEGVEGSAKSWDDFGKWYNDKILSGVDVLPDATKIKIKELVGPEQDPLKKARIVYDFVQKRSRYVSIQVGIGGWKPMPAADVDRLGYGDCKALTNYTRALLQVVDVPSFPTILYGSSRGMDIDVDLVSMQGNHMMLCIPNGQDNIWLECTSNDGPFGYQAGFTDDRNVLVVKPEGAQLVHTRAYPSQTNAQISKGQYKLSDSGHLSGAVRISSSGAQYRNKYDLPSRLPHDREAFYKDYWSNISNLKVTERGFENDRDNILFTENLGLEAVQYGNLSGSRMMFAVNAFNTFSGGVKRVRNRKTPFEIARGSFDQDEIEIELPQGFAVESLPQNITLSTPYGEYHTELSKQDSGKLLYKRTLLLRQGQYPKQDYDTFRQFAEDVSRNDNAKIVLIKKT